MSMFKSMTWGEKVLAVVALTMSVGTAYCGSPVQQQAPPVQSKPHPLPAPVPTPVVCPLLTPDQKPDPKPGQQEQKPRPLYCVEPKPTPKPEVKPQPQQQQQQQQSVVVSKPKYVK